MTDLLTDALGAIIEANPLKPSQIMEMTPEERKRQRDIANLKWLLSTFHIPTLQRHIEEAPYKVYHRVFYFWESFNEIARNNHSYLYDKKLHRLIKKLHSLWHESLSYGAQYDGSPPFDVYFFSSPGDMPLSEERQKKWDAIEKAVRRLNSAFRDLLEYVRNNYLEIDLDQLSQNAWKEYVDFYKEKPNDGQD